MIFLKISALVNDDAYLLTSYYPPFRAASPPIHLTFLFPFDQYPSQV